MAAFWAKYSLLLVLCSGTMVLAESADDDWQQLTALDAGPQLQSQSPDEARLAAMAHLANQETQVRKFLANYPDDPRLFEAKIRLVRILQIRADVTGNPKLNEEGNRLLEQLGKQATPAQAVELDFAKITFLMRTLRVNQPAQREQLRAAVRQFQHAHPGDRRIAALLVEVAQLYPAEPKTVRALLTEAEPLATQPELKAQIIDDLKRLDLVGRPLTFSFTTIDGKSVDSAQFRGSVVVLVFFAVWSKPSMEGVETVRKAIAQLPADKLQVLGVSLDTKAEPLQRRLQASAISWPVAYDGKAWEGPLVRSLGINSLPTVWLLDRQGRLRSLNALDSLANQARQLLNER